MGDTSIWKANTMINDRSPPLKVVESNKSCFKRLSVVHLYARIMFPKIVENKEFPHSYKKDE